MKLFINYFMLFSLLTSYSFSQNYNEDFLDGTIMFQLQENNLSFEIINQPRVEYKFNRLIYFNASDHHKGNAPTNNTIRLTLAFKTETV